LIEKSKETFAIPLEGYKTEAIKAGKRLVLNLTPIDKKQVKFTKSLQFFSADGLIHSDEKQIVKRLKNGAIQFDMVISEFGPKDQETLEGILSVVPYPVIACDSISIAEVVPAPVYL